MMVAYYSLYLADIIPDPELLPMALRKVVHSKQELHLPNIKEVSDVSGTKV